MKHARRCGLLAVAALWAQVATSAHASGGWTGFATPSRNIVCNGYPSKLYCVVFSASPTCQKTWMLKPTGRPAVHCLFANIGTEVPVLRYGRSVSRSGIRCLSTRRGLTCTNTAHHGFFLSRERQRTF
jgi:hypothetical protein